MSQRLAAGAAFAFVLEGDIVQTKKGGILNRPGEEGQGLGNPRLGVDVPAELDTSVFLEDGAGEDHSLLLVAQKGDGDKEDRELNLAVLLVAGLFNLHGHVGAFGLVGEGEHGAAGEEEVGEKEGRGCVFHTLKYTVKPRESGPRGLTFLK